MTKPNLENKQIILSLEAICFIEALVEKYGLEREIEEEEEVKKRIEKTDDFLTKAGIKFLFSKKIGELIKKDSLKELPSAKLKNVIEEICKGKISNEDLPNIIEKRLKISQKISKQIAKEIEEKESTVLFEKDISEEVIYKKPVSRPKPSDVSEKPSEKPEDSVELGLEDSEKSEKKEPPSGQADSYREPIE